MLKGMKSDDPPCNYYEHMLIRKYRECMKENTTEGLMIKTNIEEFSAKEKMVQSVATKIILDSIADGVFTVDKDWNITSFNRATGRITGIASRGAMDQKCFDYRFSFLMQVRNAIARSEVKSNFSLHGFCFARLQ